MKKTFMFEFEEEKTNTLTYECSMAEDEKLSTGVENGEATIYANRSALITLAKLLLKMALGPYTGGFHVHLHQDFNSELPNCLTVILTDAQNKS
jgi:hypothetical protein